MMPKDSIWNTIIININAPINVFPQRGLAGIPWGLDRQIQEHSAKTVSAPRNLTDDFGIGAGP